MQLLPEESGSVAALGRLNLIGLLVFPVSRVSNQSRIKYISRRPASLVCEKLFCCNSLAVTLDLDFCQGSIAKK